MGGEGPRHHAGPQNDAFASPSLDDPTDYVEVLRQRLSMTHQQMTAPPPPASANLYQEGSLIFVMMTPPERANKLTPRWKGPFRVKRVPNPYQVVYEDGSAWRTIHINHAKPAKLQPLISCCPHLHPSLPGQRLGISPGVCKDLALISLLLLFKQPHPFRSIITHTACRLTSREWEVSPRYRTSQSQFGNPLRDSPRIPRARYRIPPLLRPIRIPDLLLGRGDLPRLNPGLDQVCAIKGPPRTLAPQSQKSIKMARTYPLSIANNQCLGAKEEPLSFASVCLEDLRNGHKEYLTTMKQLVDALPKTENPASRFELRGHIVHRGQQRLRRSMRAALWWLLPSDGEFRRASNSLHYYLARQGRRVVLRGGDVPDPFTKIAWTGSLTPRRLHLVSQQKKPLLPLRPPFWCRLQKLLPSPRDAWGHEDREEGRRRAQPIEIRHPTRVPSRPRLRVQPMKIQLAGLPA